MPISEKKGKPRLRKADGRKVFSTGTRGEGWEKQWRTNIANGDQRHFLSLMKVEIWPLFPGEL